MISVGVGGASVRFWVCFLEAYIPLLEVVGLIMAFVLGGVFLLLGLTIATEDGIRAVVLKQIEIIALLA